MGGRGDQLWPQSSHLGGACAWTTEPAAGIYRRQHQPGASGGVSPLSGSQGGSGSGLFPRGQHKEDRVTAANQEQGIATSNGGARAGLHSTQTPGFSEKLRHPATDAQRGVSPGLCRDAPPDSVFHPLPPIPSPSQPCRGPPTAVPAFGPHLGSVS